MAFEGTNGNDSFRGRTSDEEYFGLDGDDLISGSPGADTLDGGRGTDLVDYAVFVRVGFPFTGVLFGTAIDVDLQRSVQFGGLADGDVLKGIEDVNGSPENDSIRGDAAANELHGNGGSDILDGRGGDDLLHGDFDFGPEGDDQLDGGTGNDQLFGDEGNDTLTGGFNNDLLSGGNGNDTLFGDQGVDRLQGDAGVDTATYEKSVLAVTVDLAAATGRGGDAAGDILVDVENVTGSLFNDTLVGSASANVLSGNLGNDTLVGLGGADTLDGGQGSDTASYAASGSGVAVDLSSGTGTGGDANGDTLIAIENVIGSGFTDALSGNAGANVLDGGGGADFLLGGGGNDVYVVDHAGDAVGELAGQGNDEVRASVSYALAAGSEVETLRTANDNGTVAINLTGNAFANQLIGNNGDNILGGGAGADILTGGRGIDTLSGGSGPDTFVWRATDESGAVVATADIIADFNPAEGDRFDLAQVDADVFAAGNQAFIFIGQADFSGTPGEVNFLHVDGDTIVQMQTGVGGDAEASIRIPGIVTLDASMFVL